ALAVLDRVDAPRLGLDAAYLGELFQGGDPGLVAHVILPCAHHADAERCPLVRDRGGYDELDRRILQDLLRARRPLCIRVAACELGAEVRFGGEEGDQLPTATFHRLHLPVDVAVVHPDRREADTRLAAAGAAGEDCRSCGRDARQRGCRRGTGGEANRGGQKLASGDLLHAWGRNGRGGRIGYPGESVVPQGNGEECLPAFPSVGTAG